MAELQSTQNRPKFTWLFLGTPKGGEWTGAPVTLRTEADNEQAARDKLSSWNLTFAAKIRTECPLNCSWLDMESYSSWSLLGVDHSSLKEQVLGGKQ